MHTAVMTRELSGSAARSIARRLGLAALLSAAILVPLSNVPAVAQQDVSAGSQKKSWNFKNASVQGALKALFQSMNYNYIIDQDVQGTVNVSLNDISFDVALRAILRSTNPPLTYVIENGIYHVKVKKAVEVAPQPGVDAGPGRVGPTSDKTDIQYNRYHLGINWYDVTEIAQLLNSTKGLIVVPVNTVNGAGGGGAGGGGGIGGGGGGGIGGGGGGGGGGFGGGR
jgi:type II secretory pathway component GspD/PulD (secretin)